MNGAAREIRRIIAAQGPISVAEFMRIALAAPDHGYYIRQNPISGDFITAPEISQLFGELIGLSIVQLWEDRAAPNPFRLVELGPGRGTLMADILRAAKIRPQFLAAASVHLVEISPVLRETQRRALASHNIAWHTSFESVPADAPIFILANEFFDALPSRQFVHRGGQWRERMIGLDGGFFRFTETSLPISAESFLLQLSAAPEGAVFEYSAEARKLASEIAARVVATRGAALIIDYGHVSSGFADTFQAVKEHRYADPLFAPGEADLTFHVDFEALAGMARAQGAVISGPVTQAAFLGALGIGQRAAALKSAAPRYAPSIDSAVERLTGQSQMGSLFKVLTLSSPDAPLPPGFTAC